MNSINMLFGQPRLTWRFLIFGFVLIAAPLRAEELHYLPINQPSATELLAPPPQAGSMEQAADLAEVRAVSREANSNDIAAALSEHKFNVISFAPVVGEFLQPGKLPKTEAFFHNVQKDAVSVTDGAKDFYRRPRPYVADPSLANGTLEKSFSYPSGHSTESMVIALVLAEIIPEKGDAIIAYARGVGWHRVEIARHYPTDIYAGRVLAQAIVREMNKNPAFQKDIAEVKVEIVAALK